MKNYKNYTLLLLAVCLSVFSFAQNDSVDIEIEDKEDVVLDMGGVKVVIKEKVNKTTTNEAGDSIVTSTETIEIITTDEEGEEKESLSDLKNLVMKLKEIEKEEESEPDFIETSWNDFGLGLNNLINADGKFETDAGYGNMAIDPSKSINFDWKIVTQAMNLYKGKIRLVYGIGIDFNNYRFKDNVDLLTDTIPLVALVNSENNYKKNKLVTKYLTVPVMLNFKLSPEKAKEEVYISVGANFGYLIGSHQKQVWDDGGKKKAKTKDDFNLEQFRMGYEVQFGYKKIILFGKYFPESIFKANQGPNLRSVSAGILIGKV
ncbi:MAG: hypothetical protein COA58_00765 [Bacteroidetes bacterium]|nr:MAG: hypothetical protein COA58_00765 [Bacteroidota bacterium]